jgi:transcriptional regulator with XRE-family HTH domain
MITGAQVREARELLGWTLFDLGYRAGVSVGTVSLWPLGPVGIV